MQDLAKQYRSSKENLCPSISSRDDMFIPAKKPLTKNKKYAKVKPKFLAHIKRKAEDSSDEENRPNREVCSTRILLGGKQRSDKRALIEQYAGEPKPLGQLGSSKSYSKFRSARLLASIHKMETEVKETVVDEAGRLDKSQSKHLLPSTCISKSSILDSDTSSYIRI